MKLSDSFFKRFFRVILLILSILTVSTSGYAHKMAIYAYREGDKVFGECYFADGSPCVNSRVVILNEKGAKLSEAFTDAKGLFSSEVKDPGPLKIVVMTESAHKAELKLGGSPQKRKPTDENQFKRNVVRKNENESSQLVMTKDELRIMIEEITDAKLHELRTEIKEINKKVDSVSARDIIGGIGCIIGVWALVWFIMRRKNAS
ncbi:MAG: hypothetical protein N2513_02485 [Deltaproteobacteria bacterium]|nr:hypothetical protein [Deltaproteobacteria bacterium]